MCGRFCLHSTIDPWIQLHFPGWESKGSGSAVPKSFNIAPAQSTIVCVGSKSAKSISTLEMTWGLHSRSSPAKDPGAILVNARSETLDSKPSFREAFQFRRCLVLADGFYEWKTIGRKKQPYYFSPKAGGMFAMAGIWSNSQSQNSNRQREARFCVLTTSSNQILQGIHSRMPVILDPRTYKDWLCPSLSDTRELRALMKPVSGHLLQRWPVSRRVNRVGNNSSECIGAIAENQVIQNRQRMLF